MNNETNNTWKAWVDWWPAYIMVGISLAYFVDKSGIIPKLTNKFFTKKEAE